MKLSEIKSILPTLNEMNFILPDGSFIPKHFHITEVGVNSRHFIDCGGTERIEKKVNFQLWEDVDYDHRLAPQKLLSIIELSEKVIDLGDYEIEVEYQSDTIGKYAITIEGDSFMLLATHTDCLAKDKCGIPEDKLNVRMADIGEKESSCAPGSGCC